MFNNIRDTRRKLFIVFITLTVIILIISVGFAALSSTLNITTGNITQTPQTWDVGFVPETVTPETNGTSSTGLNCPTATATKNSITFGEITLSKPDDACVYIFKVKNNGTIHADLNSIVFTEPLEESCIDDNSFKKCGNIAYGLFRMIGEGIIFNTSLTTENGYICSQETYNLMVGIAFTENTLATSEKIQTNAKFSLNFVQSNKDVCEPYLFSNPK